MKPIQHGARINHATLMGRELYRTEDKDGPVIVTQRGNTRVLSFGSGLEQSCVSLVKPAYLIHEYTQIMLLGLLFSDARRMFLLGLGGGGLVHCLSQYYPESTLQVVELRQAVIDVAYDWFDLPRLDNLQVVNADAIRYMTKLKQNCCDIIFSDLYEADGMSACQSQQDYIVACYQALSDSGCLVLNFHQKPYRGSTLMDTLESFFSELIVHDSGDQNSIMFCCKREVVLHQIALDSQAEALAKRVEMPLLPFYRRLKINGLGFS